MNEKSKPAHLLEKIGNASLVICIVVMFFPILLNIILRYAFQSGIVASDEIARLAFIYMTFIGGAIAFIEGRHIGVEGLPSMVNPRTARILRLGALTLTLITTVVLVGGAWLLILHNSGGRTPVLGLPIELAFFPILFSGGVIILSITIKAITIIRK